ncbi:methyltransferase domain-containing protein [Brachybacterium nesterenkovii]|uniref:23S rRNA (Uracil-5-)-methyltransferase rumB n=1 Tax=Brachybacterium nesterenkovii TaxID=47847 RepID=A0A1X6WSV5_9MICO|nr:methyltransferase domain-containing protein [Brachybacterium nesterenkovii]SLM87901.1 23S rRNA (Uracil-5-)-methyltransferase rumB [Brachybacterium nesterenkovii]
MRCHHFDAGTCRSCTLLDLPHGEQVRDADAALRELLAPFLIVRDGDSSGRTRDSSGRPEDRTRVATDADVLPRQADRARDDVWCAPLTSADAGFRNRAKMVVTGTANAPILGIQGQGQVGADPALLGTEDLADCPLYPPGVEELLEHVRTLIRRAQVPPYDAARHRGEIRFVHVTVGADDRMMLRLVLRSERALDRIREHLPRLLEAQPQVAVVSANIHPEHVATLEGEQEIHLAGDEFLPVTMGPVTLHARPRSFLQTNTAVAGGLYAQVADWVDEVAENDAPRDDPLRIWDLYCGVGGFALACAGRPASTRTGTGLDVGTGPDTDTDTDTDAASPASAPPVREVVGVEISEQAIIAAREAAEAAGVIATFHAQDATAWAIAEAERTGAPDVVIVNPPRRGISAELAAWIEASGVPDVVYSSCNPRTLARDLAAMPSYRIDRARLVDMFPHTRHDEVVVRLTRIGSPA